MHTDTFADTTRAHLIRDMRPYVCTYEDCRNPEQLYDARQDWIEHENSCHRKVWRCPEHLGQHFNSVDALRDHLADGHGKDTSDNLVRASESVLTLADRFCPICQFTTEIVKELHKHIAIHLERIALFSIPRSVDNDDADAGSESVNLPDDDSRGDDDSEDFRFDADDDDASYAEDGGPVRSAADIARHNWKFAIAAACEQLGSDANAIRSQAPFWKSPLHGMRTEAAEYVQQGRLREAEEIYAEVLDVRRRALGSQHPRTLTSMSDLASVYEKEGLKKKADELLAEVARVRLLLSTNPLVGAANLAVPYRNQGRPEDVKELERRLMSAAEQERQRQEQLEAESRRRIALAVSGPAATQMLTVSECQSRLFDAVRTSNHDAVDSLLSISGVNPDAFDSNLRTPLSWAAGFGDSTLVKRFLGMDNVDEDSPDARGQTPLSWAADCGHTEVVGLLLDSGRVDANSKDASGWTPLAWAASKGYEEVVKLLLARDDVDVNSESESGPTPLEWAVINGYDKVVKVFLDSGRLKMDNGEAHAKRLLEYAEKSGNDAIVEILEEYMGSGGEGDVSTIS